MNGTRVLQGKLRVSFASADPIIGWDHTPVDCHHLDLGQRLYALRDIVRGRIVFTTSFGIEDQAIVHTIFRQGLAIDVLTLDTGRLFS